MKRPNTEYRTVTDLTTRTYYFQLTTSPSVIWTDLNRFAPPAAAAVLMLDPDNIALAGDVTAQFRAAKAPF